MWEQVDACNACETEHLIGRDNSKYDRLYIFLTFTEHNYVLTVCPNCNFGTRIFVTPETAMQLLQSGIAMTVCAEPDDEIREIYRLACQEDQLSDAVSEALEEVWQREMPDTPM